MKLTIGRCLAASLQIMAIHVGTADATAQHTVTNAKDPTAAVQCLLPGAEKSRLSRQLGSAAATSMTRAVEQQTSGAPNYIGPTPNITAVANAIALRAKGLITEVAFKAGIATSKPVAIRLEYSSSAGQYRSPTQTYDTCQGNRFLYNDPISGPAKSPAHALQGRPRQMSIKVTLSEDRPNGPPHVFTIPLTANLDPHLELQYGSRSTIIVSEPR